MNSEVYELLWKLNHGYDDAMTALAGLRSHSRFSRRELQRFIGLGKEAQAATNSFLAGVIETTETAEAGRRYAKRRKREQQEEHRA
jgi:hypothetical protein